MAYAKENEELKEIAHVTFERFRCKKDGSYSSERTKNANPIFLRYEKKLKVSQIFVDLIESPHNDAYKGVGTALMQAAMEYGHSKRCKGRVALAACWSSHVFYYKLGMRAKFSEQDKRIAELATQPNKPDSSGLLSAHMYMPKQGRLEWKRKIEAHPIFQKVKLS